MALARGKLILSMLIFGTIGLFVRAIPLSSPMIALVRAAIGASFLGIGLLVRRKPVSFAALWANRARLLISGALIGFNWILLFESYRYTTVAVATLCYYLAPVFVLLAAPFILHERWTVRKAVCITVALIGMVLVSGVLDAKSGLSDVRGILYATGAAVLYAAVILLNKQMCNVEPYEMTLVQLIVAGLVILPYASSISQFAQCKPTDWLLLVTVGVIHTGLAYVMYFSSVQKLNAQTVSVFSYLDPITAVLLSALFLQEPMGIPAVIGGALVLGATLVSSFKQSD